MQAEADLFGAKLLRNFGSERAEGIEKPRNDFTAVLSPYATGKNAVRLFRRVRTVKADFGAVDFENGDFNSLLQKGARRFKHLIYARFTIKACKNAADIVQYA